MATKSTAMLERLDKRGIPKSKRKLQKHLRSAGLAYISRTGKLIPAKKVAEELCQCPHKCDSNVPMEARQHLFNHFYGLGEADLQNKFLRQHMDLRARLNIPETSTSGRPPRRITCKYLVPLLPSAETVEVCQKAFVSAFVITTKRVRLQREKLIASLGLNSYSSHNRSKNNNNTTMKNNNKSQSDIPSQSTDCDLFNYLPLPLKLMKLPSTTAAADEGTDGGGNTVTAKVPLRVKSNRKQLIDNPLIPFGILVPDGVTIAPVIATPDHDRDIAIVHNFFSNQLWKPEYIGAYS
ncbi:uncharacterized protein LOC130445411 [Diorhabda sublineata]|uniref:uncharacterized protein LOC130445411 n=1 Tax=Diorhabda sublineata TaxID=1163346 RepID=UPI0024E066F9|nr:uncharacterized protein LOC130445411 [Diorhabda sublineata]